MILRLVSHRFLRYGTNNITGITKGKSRIISCTMPSSSSSSSSSSSPSSSSSTVRRSVSIEASPSVALVDDPVHIRVTGLESDQAVTLAALLKEDGKTFLSHAFYIADKSGSVVVDQATAVGGTYTGVEPMGLIWSMHPASGQVKGLRMMKQNVALPFVFKLNVIDGHKNIQHQDDIPPPGDHNSLTTISFERYYQSPDVTAFPVRAGSIRGVLFLPPGDGPFPGVIDMFGTAGGLVQFRAALLASRGFATLALAYFNYEDLPPGLSLHLEYFEEAIDWLSNHPMVSKSGIGIVGVSKGAQLALQMATMSSKVKAVVAINPTCMHSSAEHFYRGVEQYVYNPSDEEFVIEMTEEGLAIGKSYVLTESNTKAFIPIELAEEAKFLFVFGEDDPSNDYSHLIHLVDRLKSHGKNNYVALSYPDAGHLIEPPYTPSCRSCFAKLIGTIMLYGGSPKAHSVAQEDSWRALQSFLRFHLDPDRRSPSSSASPIIPYRSIYSKL